MSNTIRILPMGRIIAALFALLLTAGTVQAKDLAVAYLDNINSSATAQMLRHILEFNTDYKVTLKKTTIADMWSGVAEGRYDGAMSVLLPDQASFMEQYAGKVEDLGPNWIGPNFTMHTIVRKGYERDDVEIVRFLNNYCLCGERLSSAVAMNADGVITDQEARSWIDENGPWVTNMMGFTRPFDDREERYVTY